MKNYWLGKRELLGRLTIDELRQLRTKNLTIAKVKDNVDTFHLGRITTEDDVMLYPFRSGNIPQIDDEIVVIDNKYWLF